MTNSSPRYESICNLIPIQPVQRMMINASPTVLHTATLRVGDKSLIFECVTHWPIFHTLAEESEDGTKRGGEY